MVFKIYISPVPENEIVFIGDAQLLNAIRDKLASKCIIHNEGDALYWRGGEHFVGLSFNIGLYNLSTFIGDQSVLQIILKFASDNSITLSAQDQYFFNFWQHEMFMVQDKKSFRPTLNEPPLYHSLAASCLLIDLFKEFEKRKYIPGYEQLFHLLENSDTLRCFAKTENYYYFNRENRFYLTQLEQFIKENKNNIFSTYKTENKIYEKNPVFLFARKQVTFIDDYLPQLTRKFK